jgi:hypothetical protein
MRVLVQFVTTTKPMSGSDRIQSVLVQREMESWRASLASLTSFRLPVWIAQRSGGSGAAEMQLASEGDLITP